MQHNTVIFDLDGTLLYSIEDLWLSTNYALQAHHLPKRSLEEVTSFVGNGVRLLIERAVPADTSATTIQSVFESFRTHYKEHMYDHTRPYDGIIDLLKELKQLNIRTAIVSNKYDAGVKMLKDQFFADLIDLAIGESSDIPKKPAPDSVLKAIEQLGSTKEHCLYIGDSDVDMKTALNAAIKGVGVTWGYRTKECLIQSGASVIIDHPSELLTLL